MATVNFRKVREPEVSGHLSPWGTLEPQALWRRETGLVLGGMTVSLKLIKEQGSHVLTGGMHGMLANVLEQDSILQVIVMYKVISMLRRKGAWVFHWLSDLTAPWSCLYRVWARCTSWISICGTGAQESVFLKMCPRDLTLIYIRLRLSLILSISLSPNINSGWVICRLSPPLYLLLDKS